MEKSVQMKLMFSVKLHWVHSYSVTKQQVQFQAMAMVSQCAIVVGFDKWCTDNTGKSSLIELTLE